MTKDFSKFQKIIDQFRGEALKKTFDADFAAATAGLQKTEKFLLKMELKRLASPCTRLIDLRGLVDGECRTYEYDEKIHFLDELAIKSFEENVAYYGSYTFGVYEAVKNTKNNFRVIYQNEKSSAQTGPPLTEEQPIFEKVQYPATFYQFGHYKDRSEERMNFVIPLEITFDNNETIEASSSDLSVNGCKLRFKSAVTVEEGDILRIRFVGLEQEFQFGVDSHFSYEVCTVLSDNKNHLVGVKRLNDQVDDSFSQFLAGFIKGNKRRYKINLDNTISALQARTLEQYVLPKSNELPIFIEQSQQGLLPRYALTSNNSQSIYQYWQDEQRRSTLHYLLKETRLAYLKSGSVTHKTLLVYSFVHSNKGQSFFYSADEQELKSNEEFASQFLAFAAAKPSFTISQLSYLPVEPQHANSSFTLSNTLSKKNAYLNAPLSNDVIATFENIPAIVVVNDITNEQVRNEYKGLSYENINKELLKTFGHKRTTQTLDIDELGINYKNHRQEPRFKYKTPAIIESAEVKCSGFSHDFSTLGLKIELETTTSFSKGDIVNLSFPALQKITSAFDLNQLPYEIVHINKKKTIINLRVYVKKHQHIGRSFFKLLIEKNKDKLTTDEYANMSPDLAKALRTVYANCSTTQTLIVQTSGSRYKIESIASGSDNSDLLAKMLQLSNRNNFYNLYPLLNNSQASSLVNASLKKMQSGDQPIENTLFIAINDEVEQVEKAVTTQLSSELNSVDEKKVFIKDALKKGSFFCINTQLSRTNEPDMDYLNPELDYISGYAIHRGKQLEQEIWSVAGVIQLTDITKETLFRYKLV